MSINDSGMITKDQKTDSSCHTFLYHMRASQQSLHHNLENIFRFFASSDLKGIFNYDLMYFNKFFS